MIGRMRTLGFRTLLSAFVNPMPMYRVDLPDVVTVADLIAARDKLRENNVPAFVCPSCSAQYFFAQLGGEQPTHWRCTCGRITPIKPPPMQPFGPMRLAPIVGGMVVLGELPAAAYAQLTSAMPVLVPTPI
jgi:hypothetical protein